jgi:RNA polymerase sigma-70 factor (ECF subfamily)
VRSDRDASSDGRSESEARELDACYREHFAFAWRVARGLGLDAAECDDVVQEIFLVVRRRWSSFDRGRSMRSWIAGIAVRVVGHHRRGRARADKREAAWPGPDPALPPDEMVARDEAAAAVARFLDSLDPDKREVFVLMDIEGLSGRETAEIVGAGAPTVYSRLREARRRFAAFIADAAEKGSR